MRNSDGLRAVGLALALLLVACNRTPAVASTAVPEPVPATATPAPVVEPTSVPTVPTVAISAWTPPPRTKTSGCVEQAGLPDAECTPGAIDPRVTQDDIGTTICTRGYTATVRPTVSVTDRIKREQMAAYGLRGQRSADYELDHLISLELGGAPADIANLWPDPWNGDANAHMKDTVENYLHDQVCRGTMPLVEAQRQIAMDWLSVYRAKRLTPAP